MSNPPLGIATPVLTDPVRLIDELKRIAVEQLGAVPGGLFRPIEEQLHDVLRIETASGAGLGGVQREDLMLVLLLRQRSATYVMRYREQIGRGFDDFCRQRLTASPDSPLGLVGERELDFHLAGGRLSESIGRLYQRELAMLDRRLEALAGALGMPPGRNPVGAIQLADAFLHIFRDADLSDTLQLLLVQQYEQALAQGLGELYERLDQQLSAAGFHLHPPSANAVQTATAAPSQAVAKAATASSDAGVYAPSHVAESTEVPSPAQSTRGGIDLFRTSAEARVRHQHLRDLLHSWRDGMGGEVSRASAANTTPHRQQLPTYNASSDRRELRTEELVSVVTLLQRDIYEPFELALSGMRELHEAIREHLLDGARRLGLDPERTCLAQREADAIDLVGLLFESLLGSHALFGEARQLFARLVMPYVRIALTDENLFVRPGHPARRLIDALAQSCESNDGASPQDRELLHCAKRVVEHVVAEYNEDLAIFDVAANELQDLLQQQRRRAEIVERRSAETVHGRERLLQARLQAGATLAQKMSERALTPTIARFLERHWQHHMVQTLARSGRDSARAQQALALADALVALDQSAARAEGGRVAEHLLDIEAALAECLSSSGLDHQATNEWLVGLARTVAFPDAPRAIRPLPAMPQLSDDSDDTRLLRVVGGTATLEFDAPVAQRMQQLRPGDWMRLIDESDEEGSVKVAWISPLTSRLLLVNRRGIRKLVASPQQLAALVKAGRLLVDSADLPFDEAMRQVHQKLSSATAAA